MAIAIEKSLISQGFLVNPEVAREHIRQYAGMVTSKISCLDAFDEFVDPNTVIGARHRIIVGPRAVDYTEDYLIGKTTEKNSNGGNYEVTLRGSNTFTEFIFEFNELSFLIGINYEGDDVNYRPNDPKKRNWFNLLRIRVKRDQDDFALANRPYGATIVASKAFDYQPILGVRDERLEDIANQFLERIKVLQALELKVEELK